jgi:glyoxylase-like metal-dependent hydrolase (beta-lactamase superfamily II)
VVDGTLFDAGLGVDPPPWSELGIERIAITHMHPDHVGGAEDAAAETGATVYQGELDYRQCVRVWGSGDWPERIADWFVSHGVPPDVTDTIIEEGHAFAPFIRYAPDPQLVREGDVVDGWTVFELPGHADGHLAFMRDGTMIGGDHLLARITPAVGLYPDSKPDPLGDYLASLERTVELAPRVVYPGHGEPIENPAERALEIVEHHRARLDVVAEALGDDPQTGFTVSVHVFGNTLSPQSRRFAVAEALSHLERLVYEGRAERGGDGRIVTYTAA